MDKHDRFYRCGFNNAAFDNEFLRTFFDLNGDNSHFMVFHPESFDVMILAGYYLGPDTRRDAVIQATPCSQDAWYKRR